MCPPYYTALLLPPMAEDMVTHHGRCHCGGVRYVKGAGKTRLGAAPYVDRQVAQPPCPAHRRLPLLCVCALRMNMQVQGESRWCICVWCGPSIAAMTCGSGGTALGIGEQAVAPVVYSCKRSRVECCMA